MSQRYDAMAVREYQDKTGTQRSQWTKVGAAFVNKDGSIGVQLDCFPIDGKIILQVPLSREDLDAKRAARNGGNQNRQGGQGGGYQQNRGYQGNRAPRQAPVQQNFGPGPGPQPAYRAEEQEADPAIDEPPFR